MLANRHPSLLPLSASLLHKKLYKELRYKNSVLNNRVVKPCVSRKPRRVLCLILTRFYCFRDLAVAMQQPYSINDLKSNEFQIVLSTKNANFSTVFARNAIINFSI